MHNLRERREAVRRARRVGHDVHGGLVGLEVHAADEHGRVGRGGRDDDLLRAALEVGRGRLGLREDARRLDDVVRAAGGPVDVRPVWKSKFYSAFALNLAIRLTG